MFEEIKKILAEIEATFAKKNEEYAGSYTDPFRNFTQAAKLNDESPEEALWGFVSKQIVSMADLVKTPEKLTVPVVNEKAGDIAVYMLILMAMTRMKK